ncbi:hypothetical protein DFJ74DRAFT_683761 [Hyaloraphidium curvatum]|nr:hypothetical protein DFJ74DRAFT_683761 [Hyaloraphidium curvatum]
MQPVAPVARAPAVRVAAAVALASERVAVAHVLVPGVAIRAVTWDAGVVGGVAAGDLARALRPLAPPGSARYPTRPREHDVDLGVGRDRTDVLAQGFSLLLGDAIRPDPGLNVMRRLAHLIHPLAEVLNAVLVGDNGIEIEQLLENPLSDVAVLRVRLQAGGNGGKEHHLVRLRSFHHPEAHELANVHHFFRAQVEQPPIQPRAPQLAQGIVGILELEQDLERQHQEHESAVRRAHSMVRPAEGLAPEARKARTVERDHQRALADRRHLVPE